MHILAPPFPALKGDVHSCPVSRLNLLSWCLPHPTDWLFLTKNKAIKRSVRSPKFLCVFPECLRTKLSSVKVIPDLIFRKATDNLPPTWMVQGMSVLMNQAECSSLNCRESWKQREDWTFCSSRNSRGFLYISGRSQRIRDCGPSTGKLQVH